MASLARILRRPLPLVLPRSSLPLAPSHRSLSSSHSLLKKGNPRGSVNGSKRAQRSEKPSQSSSENRASPAPAHPYEGSDDLGATETAQQGLHTEVMHTKGKGKKGKGRTVAGGEVANEAHAEGGKFDMDGIQGSMTKHLDRLRRDMNLIVSRVGRLTPALLDHVKVSLDPGELGTAQGGTKGERLTAYANVTVRDSEHLTVSCYDTSYIKPVELALYNDPMNLSPIKGDDGTITVTVPKPNHETRRNLLRQANSLCESARISLRQVRTAGLKASKADLSANVITEADTRKDERGLDEEVKKWSVEVDGIEKKAEKILLDE